MTEQKQTPASECPVHGTVNFQGTQEEWDFLTKKNETPIAPNIETYLGVKIVRAEPAWRSYNQLDGTGIHPKSQHTGGSKIPTIWEDGYKVIYEDGYTSWSPKDVFEKAYRRIDNLTFGLAIEALKSGKIVARKGWNGKGMYLILIDDYSLRTNAPIQLDGTGNGCLLPWIGMKTADGKLVPWLASQTDMLAEDWEILVRGY